MSLPTEFTKLYFTALSITEKEISTMPDYKKSKSTEQLLESVRRYVFNLEKKRGCINYWPFLILFTAVLWILAYAMFGFMHIPDLKISTLPLTDRLLLGVICSVTGYIVMLKARKNYYLIRELKMEIEAANAKWKELLDRKTKQKIQKSADSF